MNNRAILMPEVLRIVLAVVSILLLIVLTVALYSIFIKKTEIEQAKATLDQITTTIANLKDGEKTSFLVLSPKEWYLVYYSADGGDSVPEGCWDGEKMKNCLCICPGYGVDLVDDSPAAIKGHLFTNRHLTFIQNYGIGKNIGKGIAWLGGGDNSRVYDFFHKTGNGFNFCNKEGACVIADRTIGIQNADVSGVKWIDFMSIPRLIKLEAGANNKLPVVISADKRKEAGK